jgi:hypothetical protein
MKRVFLVLALLGTAGVTQAQTMSQPQPDKWQRIPGDPSPSASTPFGGQGPSVASQPPETARTRPQHPAMKDTRGNMITPPQSKTP